MVIEIKIVVTFGNIDGEGHAGRMDIIYTLSWLVVRKLHTYVNIH